MRITLTLDDEYFRHIRKNLLLPLPMQKSEKPKILCCYFIASLKSTLNFDYFQKKKKNAHSLSFLKLLTLKNVLT